MIACDIDGTLLDYDYIPGQPPKINHALIEQLRGKEIALVTNQGGLPFGVKGANRKDGRRYPTPEDFVDRLKHLLQACYSAGIDVLYLRVCTFHPKADNDLLDRAAFQLREELYGLNGINWEVHDEDRYRKPFPLMLLQVHATIYYGDSDEDEQAAANAGIEFVRVGRFTGEK